MALEAATSGDDQFVIASLPPDVWAAAHQEREMVAGGWNTPVPSALGRSDVNSSIGSSWNQSGRSGMGATATKRLGAAMGRPI